MDDSLDSLTRKTEMVLASIKLWIPLRDNALIELNNLATRIAKVERDKNIAKTSTLPVAIAGGLTIAGAGLLSIVTVGLGTPLMVAAVGGTVAAVSGSVASGATSLVCHSMEKDALEAAQKILDKDKKGQDDIVKQLKEIDEQYTKYNNSIKMEGRFNIGSAVSMGTSALTTTSRLVTPTLSAAGSTAATVAVGAVRGVCVAASAVCVVLDSVQLGFSIANLVKGSPSEAAEKVREAIISMKANLKQLIAVQDSLKTKLSELKKQKEEEEKQKREKEARKRRGEEEARKIREVAAAKANKWDEEARNKREKEDQKKKVEEDKKMKAIQYSENHACFKNAFLLFSILLPMWVIFLVSFNYLLK